MTPYKDRPSNKKLAIIENKILKIFRIGRITHPAVFEVELLMGLHTKLNLEKFSFHQKKIFNGNSYGKFEELSLKAIEINHYICLRAIPLCGATQIKILKEDIDCKQGIRFAISSLLTKVQKKPVAKLKYIRAVSRRTLTNWTIGNQIPQFNSLMNFCLVHGYALQIAILPYRNFD